MACIGGLNTGGGLTAAETKDGDFWTTEALPLWWHRATQLNHLFFTTIRVHGDQQGPETDRETSTWRFTTNFNRDMFRTRLDIRRSGTSPRVASLSTAFIIGLNTQRATAVSFCQFSHLGYHLFFAGDFSTFTVHGVSDGELGN